MEAIYVGKTLGEDNIMGVWFEDLNKDAMVELALYIINHVVEASRRKGSFNTWVVKVLKGRNRDITNIYHVR